MRKRIADIQIDNLYFSYPNGGGFKYAGGTVTARVTSIIRVITEDGMTGLGAAYSYPDLLSLIVRRQLKPMLLGDDPLEIDALWEKMYQLTRWYGRKGAAISALGGIDNALWDLRGKVLGKPVYKLLGGTNPNVPAYASGLFWQDTREIEREACRHRERGFRRVKMRIGHSYDYDVAAVEAARRGVGDDGDVLVDGSHRYTVATAKQIAKFLADMKVFWFEEPFPPEDIDSYVALRPCLKVPLAAGENEFGVQGFREILRAQAVGIAQPDASRTGGISECVRIARMAAQSGVRVAPHTWSDAVTVIANAHFVAATPNAISVEVDQTGNPFIENLLAEPLNIKDGLLTLSDEPGFGIELNLASVARLAVPEGQLIPDGNYSDLIFGQQYWSVSPPYAERTPRPESMKNRSDKESEKGAKTEKI